MGVLFWVAAALAARLIHPRDKLVGVFGGAIERRASFARMLAFDNSRGQVFEKPANKHSGERGLRPLAIRPCP